MDKDYIIERIKLLTVWLQTILTLSIVVASGVVTFYISNLDDIHLIEKKIIVIGFFVVMVGVIIIIVIINRINHFINLLKK